MLQLEHQHQRMPSYSILPSQKATLLLIPYYFTISPTSQNSIFIKILFFNLSLLFLSNRYFFQTRRDSIFLGFPIVFFFLSLPQPLAQTTNTNKHKPLNPRCISLPPSTTTLSLNRIFFPQSPLTSSTNHKHKHKQNTNPQTPAVLVSLPQPQPSPSIVFFFLSHTHKHKSSNPCRSETHAIKPSNQQSHRSETHAIKPSNQQSHQSETHAADLKPTRANPLKRNHHRSHHLSYR